jgi:hypothetical protein
MATEQRMSAQLKTTTKPALLTLIDELARRAARDYLTERAAQECASTQSGSNRDALPDLNEAA